MLTQFKHVPVVDKVLTYFRLRRFRLRFVFYSWTVRRSCPFACAAYLPPLFGLRARCTPAIGPPT